MAKSKYTQDHEAEGPPMQRMLPGLPNTPLGNIKELFLAVIMIGLNDDDHEFVLSPGFEGFCAVVGFSRDQTDNLRIRYCLNQLDTSRLDVRTLHRPRFEYGDSRAEQPNWQSWPDPSARTLRR